MSAPQRLIFIDTETTGLDPAIHEIWELAWAEDDADEDYVFTFRLDHDLRTADPEALKINRYFARRGTPRGPAEEQQFKAYLAGATLIGANPAFDAAFLAARWRARPWHHRLIDVEALALQEFGWERPRGLSGVADAVHSLGFPVYPPDHTAGGDVRTTRDCFRALRTLARNRIQGERE